jgi:2-polyprenyl-3-methyl-5-hydroxy-6-metoxy-1,4-benzoquinol methylase
MPQGAPDHVLDRERLFHDAGAAGTAVDDVRVRSAFEAITAPENRLILSLMGDLSGLRRLDLGSGLGESAVTFALRGAHVTATDVSPEMCALALETGKRHVGRIFEEVKRRPLYVVSHTLGEPWPGGARADGPGKA